MTDGLQVFGPALGADPAGDARAAEAAGFAGVRVIDHLFCALPGGPEAHAEHPFVSLGAAAAVTRRVLLTQTVLDVTRRHPTEMAQAVATLDRISGGRAELGLGTGWYEREHEAVRVALGPPAERVERLVDALTICRAMFAADGCVDHTGRHYSARVDVPWPPTPHRVEVTVGAARPVLVRRAAELADRLELLSPTVSSGAVPDAATLSLDDVAGRLGIARDAARAAGRPAGALRFSARVELRLGASPDERDALTLAGTPDDVVSGAAALAGLGVDRLCILPADPASRAWLATAAHDLAGGDEHDGDPRRRNRQPDHQEADVRP
jgi:alkanesulfonate monooxygenase SsuD/methylene tetrahydromethanopterin reductase-like flavin-dependent oxidoreductase (luciferase family)